MSSTLNARRLEGPVGPHSAATRGVLGWAPEVWVLATMTAVGALLRFSTLGHQSFWVDEATTVHEVGLSFGGMLHAVAHNEATPPLYFVCAWVWTRIFGSGEVGIRSFSAVLGTATIPVVYGCGRELVSRWAGVAAASLTAISPFMIWYSQEARAYMLLAFLSGLSLLFTARAVRTERPRDHVSWAVFSILALAAHFFAVLLVIPEGIWLVWRLRSRVAGTVLATVVMAEGALSLLAVTDASHDLDLWIGGLPLHTRIQAIPVDFAASQLYRTPTLRWGLWCAGGVVVLLGLLAWLSTAERRRASLLPAGLAAIVIGVPLLGTAVGRDYVLSRNLTPAWIPLVILVAGLAGAERARALGLALLATLALLFVWADVRISTDASLQRPDWRAAAQALGPPTTARAVLIYDGNVAEEPLSLYLPGTTFSYSGAPAAGPTFRMGEVDVIADVVSRPVPRLPAGFRLISSRVVGGHEVARFELTRPRRFTPQRAASLAESLVVPADTSTSVLVQR